jgi:nitroreductase
VRQTLKRCWLSSRSFPGLGTGNSAIRITRRRILGTVALALLFRPAKAEEEPRCLDRILTRRRMIRKFRPDPVSDALVSRFIHAAMRAPSAGHTQPWSYVVVRDTPTRRRLARAALGQMFVADAPVVVVPCADRSRSRARYGESEGDHYAVIDTAFSSLLLLLAVAEEGLGACFVGAFDEEQVSRILDLPELVRPLAVIPIGLAAERPRRLALRRLDDVLHFERW